MKQLAKIGLTVGIGVEQYKYIRERHSDLVSEVQVNKTFVGPGKKAKYLLTPPDLTLYQKIINIIPRGDYHILDERGILVAAATSM